MTILKKSVSLNPGESKVVDFQFIPPEAKTYQVMVGNLIGSFVAGEMPTAEFIYVSGIRLSYLSYLGHDYFLLEIDIQNVGQGSGECTITSYLMLIVEGHTPYGVKTGWYGTPSGLLRSAMLQPGEIITFSARVDDVYRFPQKYKVESEAGAIETLVYPPYWTP